MDLTIAGNAARYAHVMRCRKSFIVFMAAFWLFATQHCGLEAAGVLIHDCDHADGPQSCAGADHEVDGCKTVENGEYRIIDNGAKVMAPQLVACVCLIYLKITEPQPEQISGLSSVANVERPRDWVPTWQFVRRAALSPRAPSLL